MVRGVFNSCTNAYNHFQKRHSGSSEVPKEGKSAIIFAPALKIVDKKQIPACLHTPAVSHRALQTLHVFCAQVSFPWDCPRSFSWKNSNSDSTLFCCMSNMFLLFTCDCPVGLRIPWMSSALFIPWESLQFWTPAPMWLSLPLSPCGWGHSDMLSVGQP